MRRILPVFVVFALFSAPVEEARAEIVFGVHGGLYTPTRDYKDLLAQEWQVGVRTILPPYPLHFLDVKMLHLDLSLDMGLAAVRALDARTADAQRVNLTSVWRYSVPFGDTQQWWWYLGAGVRLSTLWGDLRGEVRDGNLFGLFTGSVQATTGFTRWLGAGRKAAFDIRAGYGILGFTSWEASAGLLFVLG